MPLASDRCICLQKTEYSETSQILLLLCRSHGLVRLMAKGAHRQTKAGAGKFDGGIDLLELGEARFHLHADRDLSLLTEWKLLEGHLPLRRTLRGMYLGLYAAELIGALFEQQDPHPPLFDALQAALAELHSPQREQIFMALQLDILRQAGYLPEFSLCAQCGASTRQRPAAAFSSQRGGIVCAQCQEQTPDRIALDPRLLRLAQSLLNLPRHDGVPKRLPQLSLHQTNPLNRLLANYVQHTLGKRLRLAPWIIERN